MKHLIPDFPHLGKKRADSSNRTASYIMVDDILDMFKALDNVQREDIPAFMCDDASKLSPISPEASCRQHDGCDGKCSCTAEKTSAYSRDYV